MGSHLFFYQFALLARVWLFFLLLSTWPSEHARYPHPAAPIAPHRQRSNDPTPCAGLTQKPHCTLCEPDVPHAQGPPAVRPDSMPPPHRRPRTVDTSQHFCPHTGCRYRGWLGLGTLRANGHPRGGPWRPCHCPACQGDLPEQHGTLLHGKQGAVELIVRVLACLAAGFGRRATARVFEVAAHPVLQWWVEAAEQLRAFAAFFLCDVPVRQLPLDEWYAVLRGVSNGEISEDDALKRCERSRHGVWTVLDPASTLLLAPAIGPRTLALAQRVGPQGT